MKLRGFLDNGAELFDKPGSEILVFIPKVDQTLNLLGMLWRIREGSNALDEIRKERLQFDREAGVAAPDMNMVKHIVEEV